MNKELLDLVADDDRIPDELKAKLVVVGLKMNKCKTISEAKQALLALIDVMTEVEKLTE